MKRIIAIVLAVFAFLMLLCEPTAEESAAWLATMAWTKMAGFALMLIVAGMGNNKDE